MTGLECLAAQTASIEEQKAVRLALWRAGRTPLPLKPMLDGTEKPGDMISCKACLLPGWTTRDFDEAAVRRMEQTATTGMRIEADDLVLDLDIDDPVNDTIVAAIMAAEPGLLHRTGKGHKAALLGRIHGALGEYQPTHFIKGDKRGMAEIFTQSKAHPNRQIGVSGIHTGRVGDSFFTTLEPAITYQWKTAAPWEVDIDDLPTLTANRVMALVSLVHAHLQKAGWVIDTTATRAQRAAGKAREGRQLPPGAIKALGLSKGDRIAADDVGVDFLVGANPTRLICVESRDGDGAGLFDTESGLTHWEFTERRAPGAALTDKTRAALGRLSTPAGIPEPEPFPADLLPEIRSAIKSAEFINYDLWLRLSRASREELDAVRDQSAGTRNEAVWDVASMLLDWRLAGEAEADRRGLR